jgi:hypothetical protein
MKLNYSFNNFNWWYILPSKTLPEYAIKLLIHRHIDTYKLRHVLCYQIIGPDYLHNELIRLANGCSYTSHSHPWVHYSLSTIHTSSTFLCCILDTRFLYNTGILISNLYLQWNPLKRHPDISTNRLCRHWHQDPVRPPILYVQNSPFNSTSAYKYDPLRRHNISVPKKTWRFWTKIF